MSPDAGRVELTENTITLSYTSTVDTTDISAVGDLAQLRAVKDALKMWEHELEGWISDALGRNETDVEGVGHVQVKRGANRTEWDKPMLLRALLDSHRPPTGDGELDPTDDGHATIDTEQFSCSPDLSRVLDCFNLPSPRVTALRDRGIDPDELATVTAGKVSVVIT